MLAVGGIEPRKGTLDLLEAYARLRDAEDTRDLALVVAGGETLFDYRGYRAEFDRRALELEVVPVLLGVVADDALPSLVAAASVLGFVWTKEGFGLAAMEALAAGVPLVARDLPVLHEVFDGAARFAADPASMAAALTAAVTVPDPVLTQQGRVLAARHDWPGAAARHLDFYRKQPGPGSVRVGDG